jgi:ATP-dependent RNA helicase DDX23/PRP28
MMEHDSAVAINDNHVHKRHRPDNNMVGDEDISALMTEEEKREAEKMARIAELAEQRALARQQQKQHQERQQEQQKITASGSNGINNGDAGSKSHKVSSSSAVFLSKAERERIALEKLHKSREEEEQKAREAEKAHMRFATGQALEDRKAEEKRRLEREELERERRQREENKESKELDNETRAIRDHYLGVVEKKRKLLKPSEKFARVFQFEWEQDDDTAKNDLDPLYSNRTKIHSLFGRGYIAGVDQRDQRKGSNFLVSLTEKRLAEIESQHGGLTEQEKQERSKTRDKMTAALKKKYEELESEKSSTAVSSSHWSSKPLATMTDRDWRIFREDFDIRIQGGRATLPLRNWNEAGFPEPVMRAISEAGYQNPSPIQRQAIPVAQSRKDIIGIAETGSGKTAAFTIPLLCALMNAPKESIDRCGDQGPIAIVMAPTRELAQQIYEECCKLAKYTDFSACCVVGGQSIEQQGFKLRQGVHIVIGTPGRLCDCLQNNYLVLNQCCFVVLDEADRMVRECAFIFPV